MFSDGILRYLTYLSLRERDKRLELVTTRLAFPQVLYAMPIQISRPIWQEHCLPAAQTFASPARGLTVGNGHDACPSFETWRLGLATGIGNEETKISHRTEPRPLSHV